MEVLLRVAMAKRWYLYPDFHAICAHYKLGTCRVFIKTG